MEINIVSDLHFDCSRIEPVLPGGEILVLAGDICESRLFHKYVEGDSYFADPNIVGTYRERFNLWLADVASRYKKVIYVAGNHEHYRGVFDHTIPHMKANVPDNVHVLDNEMLEIDGVLFLGGTLWTDCEKGNPMTLTVLQHSMADYRYIKKIRHNEYMPLLPYDTIREHNTTLAYFRTVMQFPHNKDKQVFVVTHHAPSALSVSDVYKVDSLNGGFYSDLSEFILDHPQITHWVHGHTHTRFDYQIGDTRVICNPRGYIPKNGDPEVTDYDPNFTVTI